MYIQISTKCNFSCDHCAFNCTMHGKHMSQKVFQAALNLAVMYDDSISLGGGEPTLHPHFWSFLGQALGSSENVWLATNGSQTQTAIKLANMAKKGILGVALSLDYWHDPISPEVKKAFTKEKYSYQNDHDYREIRNVGKEGNEERLAPFRGNAENGGNEKVCPCEDIFITPNGNVYFCGCKSKLLGNVMKDDISIPYEDRCDFPCYRSFLINQSEQLLSPESEQNMTKQDNESNEVKLE